MCNKKKIDLVNWSRKNHFELFQTYDNPQFSVAADVDCTNLYNYTKQNKISFYLAYLFISNKITNEIDEFKLRIEDDDVFLYDMLHPSSTIAKKDETFGFAYFTTTERFQEFHRNSKMEIERINNTKELVLNDRINTIYYSVLPWVSFTSIQHPEVNSVKNSIPKIVFGKLNEINGKLKMPISITANHSLMDGIHFGKYFQRFEKYSQIPEIIISD